MAVVKQVESGQQPREQAGARPSVAPVDPTSAASIGSQLDAELDRIAALGRQLASQATGFQPSPIAEPLSALPSIVQKSNAREAWSAVIIMGLFIVAGFAWTTHRIQNADTQVTLLERQLQEKKTAIVSYQQQIKKLRTELAEAQSKLKHPQTSR